MPGDLRWQKMARWVIPMTEYPLCRGALNAAPSVLLYAAEDVPDGLRDPNLRRLLGNTDCAHASPAVTFDEVTGFLAPLAHWTGTADSATQLAAQG